MGSLLAAGGLITAFFAGSVALFAPCCVVFLLPGYLAGAVKNRRWRLIPLTLVFTLGLGLVVIPITTGITMISSFITANHTLVFTLGALLMVIFAVLSVSGHMWSMPSAVRSPTLDHGDYPGFFAFGVFSGIASSCCAPVLAGVLTLSAVSQSPMQAVMLGVAYVFGMVFPLMLIAMLWDVFDLGRRSFSPKPIVWHFAGRTVHTNLINLAVAIGFLVMAVLIGVTAFSGTMPSSQQQPLGFLGSWIASLTAPIAATVSAIPLVAQGAMLIALAALVITVANIAPAHRRRRSADTEADADAERDHALAAILAEERNRVGLNEPDEPDALSTLNTPDSRAYTPSEHKHQ